MELTKGQSEGLKIAVARFHSKEKYTVIAGYAGSGKDEHSKQYGDVYYDGHHHGPDNLLIDIFYDIQDKAIHYDAMEIGNLAPVEKSLTIKYCPLCGKEL